MNAQFENSQFYPPASETETENKITIRSAGNEDQPAGLANDRLGFKPYVEAVYSYLKNPLTKAPFTVSIIYEATGY